MTAALVLKNLPTLAEMVEYDAVVCQINFEAEFHKIETEVWQNKQSLARFIASGQT